MEKDNWAIAHKSLSSSVRMCTVLVNLLPIPFEIIYSTCCCDFAMERSTSVGSARLRSGDYLEPNAVLWTWLLNVIGVWPRCKNSLIRDN